MADDSTTEHGISGYSQIPYGDFVLKLDLDCYLVGEGKITDEHAGESTITDIIVLTSLICG